MGFLDWLLKDREVSSVEVKTVAKPNVKVAVKKTAPKKTTKKAAPKKNTKKPTKKK